LVNILTRIERLPLGRLWSFALKQAWAALFGGLMLAALIATAYIDLPWLSRYDWLFLIAIGIQLFMLATRLERPHEVITIVAFHLTGLGMELFKTSSVINAWTYPGDAIFRLGNVPLFSGFMYAAVGSYMARSWRVFGLQFSRFPSRLATSVLALAIYINFFSHHFTYDIRYVLFAAVLLLYGPVWVTYTINTHVRRMPLVVGFVLIATFIWLAENISTYVHVWLYPNQVAQWHPVGLAKLGSWFLLMIVSFIMVDLLQYARARLAARRDAGAPAPLTRPAA
jgi:uncharacterized membrane protein YoaT (DUF817 family)